MNWGTFVWGRDVWSEAEPPYALPGTPSYNVTLTTSELDATVTSGETQAQLEEE